MTNHHHNVCSTVYSGSWTGGQIVSPGLHHGTGDCPEDGDIHRVLPSTETHETGPGGHRTHPAHCQWSSKYKVEAITIIYIIINYKVISVQRCLDVSFKKNGAHHNKIEIIDHFIMFDFTTMPLCYLHDFRKFQKLMVKPTLSDNRCVQHILKL